jgi:MerR family transcriptional regulator, copper efflux regulator
MTIGSLARRTGMPVKMLREYEDMGLIYSVGRSPGNYRLFGQDALWCVEMVRTLRGLGLTLAEIQALAGALLREADRPIGPRLRDALRLARIRTEERIDAQREVVRRIDRFTSLHADELAGKKDFIFPLDPTPRGRA